MRAFKVFLAIAAAFILLVQSRTASIAAGLIGGTAHDFTLEDISGKTHSLGDYKGRVVFIDFWASWCPPCKKEFPEINAMLKAYEGADVVGIAVNIDKKRSHAEDFLRGVGALSKNLVVLLDPESAAIRHYNALTMPTSYILDKSGVVRFVHFGYNESDAQKWKQEIDRLLKE
ncbi:MAG: TlpA disulfide reductase family protein [Deltaproteobacteria bacterium]